MDFSKHIQKAEEALRRRNYDFAVDLFRNLIDLDPDLFEARSGLRMALKKRAEAKKGGKLLRAVSGALPLSRAKALAKLGKHEACARAMESYLGSNPLDVDGNLLLGQSLEGAEHYNAARAVYEFVAEIAPTNPEGLKRAGAMMYKSGDHVRALEYYERALEADPRDQEALKARKNLAAESALTHTALDSAGHSRERMQQQDEEVQLDRKQKRHMDADELKALLERLEGRLADEPRDTELMLEISEVHVSLKDFEAALEFAERVGQYRRGDYEVVCMIGDLKARALKKRISKADGAGNADEASRIEEELRSVEIDDFEERARLRPGDLSLQYQLARRLMRAERLDEAIAALQKCREDPRVKRDALFLLGQGFQKKGVLDLARKEYERALDGSTKVDDRTKEILYNLGRIAEDREEADEARSFYLRIYEVDIGYRDVASKLETPA